MGTPTRRRWIKLYPVECLDGSIRYQLDPDERGVWYDLLNFAAVCTNTGMIADRAGRPIPHSFIANRLNIPLKLLDATLQKCQDEGRLKEDENGIQIMNWSTYQSEYDRQKPYRDKVKEFESSGIDKQIVDRQNELYRLKKAELGREPTPAEWQEIRDEVAKEFGQEKP